MNHLNRNAITATRKRKDNPSLFSHKGSFVNTNKKQQFPSLPLNKTNITTPTLTPSQYKYNNNNKPNVGSFSGSAREPGSGSWSGSSNRILAGYMANEFLTKGTLFGQKFDPARAEAVPVSAAEPMRKPGVEPVGVKPNRNYDEVARLLKGDGSSTSSGAHIPGIFNPTQLARWIQM